MSPPRAAHLYTTLAPYYDRLDGAARDYVADVRWLHHVFRAHKVQSVLDVACGTASHALRLARLGYRVTPMDASAEMLRVARRKAAQEGITLKFTRGDYRRHRFTPRFDAAICMYWTLGSHLTDDELGVALANVRACLRERGLFTFDVENADGIKRQQLDHLFSDYALHEGNVSLVRFNQSRLEGDTILDWQAIYLMQTRQKLTMLRDRVKLRFFYVAELTRLLEQARFRVLRVWGGPGTRFDPTGPSLYMVARRA